MTERLITHLRHVDLAVPDFGTQRDFYLDLWGLTEVAKDGDLSYLAAEGSAEPFVVRLRKSADKRIDLIGIGAADKASVDQQQWFPKGTGPEAGKTRALPEIWSKPDDFTAAQKMFSERAPKLLAAAKTKDVAAVTAAFKDVGGACKNCHDTFRKPED